MKKKIKIALLLSGIAISGSVNAQTYYGSGYQNQNNNANVYYGNGNNGNTSQVREKYYFNNQTQTTIKESPKTASSSTSTQIYFKTGSKPCWDQAAAYHNVDPWLLMSIAKVESGFNPSAFNGNRNGSYDLGMMQINSSWFPRLKKMGITQEMLKDACTSTYVGAWILSHNIKQYGYTWRAIGAYNSPKVSIGYKYARKVYAAHSSLTGQYAMNNWQ